jgi:hypothetical protein
MIHSSLSGQLFHLSPFPKRGRKGSRFTKGNTPVKAGRAEWSWGDRSGPSRETLLQIISHGSVGKPTIGKL